jgi:hypothetical protein
MVKRQNRIESIEHERQQLEILKGLEPNTTPARYQLLSNGLVDVAASALDLIAALESSSVPDFERLYDLVDGLADLVDAQPEQLAEDKPVASTQAQRAPALKTNRSAGGVSQVKTTIIGRPDRIEIQGDTIVLHMAYSPKPGSNGIYSLPKGVPTPQDVSTPLIAYVGRKQFEKVKPQLDNPDDSLIIEGAVTQLVNGVLTVYASNITTKLLQQAKSEQQKSQAQGG